MCISDLILMLCVRYISGGGGGDSDFIRVGMQRRQNVNIGPTLIYYNLLALTCAKRSG